MGEAKRREDLGPTRQIRFEGYELMDVITFLVPQYPPDDPRATAAQKKIGRDMRRPLRSALEQLGILDIWHIARKRALQPGELKAAKVCTLTVDAINTLLTLFNVEMDYRDTLNVGEIEDRLEDAKAGIYVLPPPEVTAEEKPAEAETPSQAPVLEVVPAPTE
jgi:hypothetical protein